MSAWPSQPSVRLIRRFDVRPALGVGLLVCVLVAEGMAISHSYLWAAPLLGVLLIALAVEIPLVPFLGVTLLVRILTDSLSGLDSRHSGSVNLSGGIAMLLMLVAIGLLLRRQRGALPALLAVVWLCIWTAVAVKTSGASTETLREGVREGSVVALAVIVYNSREAVTVPVATRLVQFVGFVPALLALYQFATQTGVDVSGQIRANGTLVLPNSAAMFFALAAIASLWRYLDYGRRRSDALLMALFAGATIATFSIGGLATLLAMIMSFGMLRPGAFRFKLGACAAAGLVVIVFLATPLGAERISQESSTNLSTAERGKANSTLAWRLYKWKTLLPEWEASPLLGQGLGTTATAEATSTDRLTGVVPHNEYIRYLVETGIAGLAVLLWALGFLISRLVRKRPVPGTLKAGTMNAPALALAVIIGCLVNSLGDNTLLDSPTCYASVLIIAAVLCIPNAATRQASVPQATRLGTT
jgi:O-antigen ligase